MDIPLLTENPIPKAFFLCTECGRLFENGMHTLEGYCPECHKEDMHPIKMAVYHTKNWAVAEQQRWKVMRADMEQILGDK